MELTRRLWPVRNRLLPVGENPRRATFPGDAARLASR
jgi:hypothetical protein